MANKQAAPQNAYNPDGYDYVVNLPTGGPLNVFDPGFCAMGGNGAGQHGRRRPLDRELGHAGVHLLHAVEHQWQARAAPVPGRRSTRRGTYSRARRGTTPLTSARRQARRRGRWLQLHGRDTYHNAWWTIPTGSLAVGTYAIQVQTTKTAHVGVAADPSQNQNTSAENMFSLEAVGGADASGNAPQIYGNGKMVVYNNLLAAPPPSSSTWPGSTSRRVPARRRSSTCGIRATSAQVVVRTARSNC